MVLTTFGDFTIVLRMCKQTKISIFSENELSLPAEIHSYILYFNPKDMDVNQMFELFTLVTGVVYIILEIVQSKWMWVVGVLTALAAMFVFWNEALYASFGLNCYYLVMSGVGLWQWNKDEKQQRNQDAKQQRNQDAKLQGYNEENLRGRNKIIQQENKIHLSRLSAKIVIISTVFMIAGTLLFYMILRYLGDSQSVLDASVTILSAIATWWLAKSYKEQWLLWIIADVASMVMCAIGGLWWMSALYLAYSLSAVYGYNYWRKNGSYISGELK